MPLEASEMPPGEEQLVADARNAPLRRLREVRGDFFVHLYALCLKNWRVQSRGWKTMLLFVLAPAAFVLVLFAIKRWALINHAHQHSN